MTDELNKDLISRFFYDLIFFPSVFLLFPCSASRHVIQSWRRLTYSRWQWSIYKITRLICNVNKRQCRKQLTQQWRPNSKLVSLNAQAKSSDILELNRKSNDDFFNICMAASLVMSDTRHFIIFNSNKILHKFNFFHRHRAHPSKIRFLISQQRRTDISSLTATRTMPTMFSWFPRNFQMEISPLSYHNHLLLNFLSSYRCHRELHRPDLPTPQAMNECVNNRRHLTINLHRQQIHRTNQPIIIFHIEDQWVHRQRHSHW